MKKFLSCFAPVAMSVSAIGNLAIWSNGGDWRIAFYSCAAAWFAVLLWFSEQSQHSRM